jgi:hypothetical protein
VACLPGTWTHVHLEVCGHLVEVVPRILDGIVGVQDQQRVPTLALGDLLLDLRCACGDGNEPGRAG